jgi:predicted  nucleic acid-binding Zn-ribbon protein
MKDKQKKQELNRKIDNIKAREAAIEQKAAALQVKEQELKETESSVSSQIISAKGDLDKNMQTINNS